MLCKEARERECVITFLSAGFAMVRGCVCRGGGGGCAGGGGKPMGVESGGTKLLSFFVVVVVLALASHAGRVSERLPVCE